ncbi:hypothetical protein C5F47_06235 [Nitrosopumilus cobalaminigenes]|uniref:Peptidase n=1 Tax=Nitrosopumilus cobalaminigenes TaxID=1470066 RepID=A0A7D5LZG3_9ARCH|nr:hypothetical protein [Nitrosopumilus cobalaminigenes]QLH03174.1 hypothetical protein C5F47_06235 [Nitrosopumilus cobalaminigenes]
MNFRLTIIFTISIISILGLSLTVSASDSSIPDWVKNNAKWWSEGSISETDYISSLEYLIENKIIEIPSPLTEVTAAQTMYPNEENAQSFRIVISNIVEPFSVHFFEKFAFASADSADPNDPRGRVYDFRDSNPQFYLESLPSSGKINYYNFISDWMDKGASLNEFDIDVEVIDGYGIVIQTWAFTKCEITGYGTYLHDTTFIYSYSGIQDTEIRDRTNFSCTGVSLETP